MTTVTDETIAKFTRFVAGLTERTLKGSLNVEDFISITQVILGKGPRLDNLLEYALAGCPKINWSDPKAPKVKRGKMASKTINPAEALVTTSATSDMEALWVDSDLPGLVSLEPCEADERPLQHLLTLPKAMNDSTIAKNVGGLATLTSRKATMGQLIRELGLARSGQKGLFKKGRYYLLYLEGLDGSLVTVLVYWNAVSQKWNVRCCRFDQVGKWNEGREVCGN
jgi:hypothetical protein